MNFEKISLDPKKIQSIFETINMKAIEEVERQKLIAELEKLFQGYEMETEIFMSHRFVRFDDFTQEIIIEFSLDEYTFSYLLKELTYNVCSI